MPFAGDSSHSEGGVVRGYTLIPPKGETPLSVDFAFLDFASFLHPFVDFNRFTKTTFSLVSVKSFTFFNFSVISFTFLFSLVSEYLFSFPALPGSRVEPL